MASRQLCEAAELPSHTPVAALAALAVSTLETTKNATNRCPSIERCYGREHSRVKASTPTLRRCEAIQAVAPARRVEQLVSAVVHEPSSGDGGRRTSGLERRPRLGR